MSQFKDEFKWPRESAWGQLQQRVSQTRVETNDLAFNLREAARKVEQYAAENASLWQQLEEARLETQRLREDYEDHLGRCAGEREED